MVGWKHIPIHPDGTGSTRVHHLGGHMQLEVGDMILWGDPEDRDIGWIVHTEGRYKASSADNRLLLYIVWASCGDTDTIWAEYILNKDFVTIIKGGQHDR